MNLIHQTLLLLKTDKRAVALTEYALVASLIVVVIIGAVSELGHNVSGTLTKISSEF